MYVHIDIHTYFHMQFIIKQINYMYCIKLALNSTKLGIDKFLNLKNILLLLHVIL